MTHRVPLSESKETSRRMLAKLTGDAQLGSVGLADPFAKHKARPLSEHLDDFRRGLAAKGNTADHVAKTYTRCKAVVEGCRFESTEDLQASAVVEFLATLKDDGRPRLELPMGQEWFTKAELVAVLSCHPHSVARMLRGRTLRAEGNGKARQFHRETVEALQDLLCGGLGTTTRNHYLTAVKGFTRWLTRDGRIAVDPLAHLSRQNEEADVRRKRRAMKADQFGAFVEAAGSGKPFRGITGPDRLVLYTLAANTGFRSDELASLTPASFDFDAEPPTVTVEAAYSKHRREDVQPIRADVAEVLRLFVRGKPSRQRLWPGPWHERSADMIRADLEAAGIPYQDDAGRFFDFHAVRGQFISQLAAAGVHPSVAKVLARHSTITLTMDYYTHLDVLDVAGALDKLPPVGGEKTAPTERSKKERRERRA